jgi:HK97 family phage prohead protease
VSARHARPSRRRPLERRAPPAAPPAELVRVVAAQSLLVRAGDSPGGERIIEGLVLPYGEVAQVDDGAGPYRESIARGAPGEVDPSEVLFEYLPQPNRGQGHQGATLVGRGATVRAADDGLHMAFGISRTHHGDEALELARDGILNGLSVVMDPIRQRRRPDGVIERTAIRIRRVALLERGAYATARVAAVRAAPEDAMHTCNDCGAELVPGVAHICPTRARRPSSGTRSRAAAAATAAPADDDGEADDGEDDAEDAPAPATGTRRQRTRVTVDVERAAAERSAAGRVGRSFAPFGSTREEAVYGPGSGQSFFGDGFRVSERSAGWEEAAGRLDRHYRHLEDIDVAIQRVVGISGLQRAAAILERAGDVLSSEIPGAYPSEYMPGLIVPRILKGRPMGGFYSRVPLTDGRPRIYPVVSTSTSVAVQSAEAANPAASDFATTATTVTPLLYGGETKVSRQVLDGADPSIDAMLSQDLAEAYVQASEAIIRAAIEAGSTASGVTLTAATPDAGLRALWANHIANVFMTPDRLFIPTTLTASWLAQNDTTGRPVAPVYNPAGTDSVALADVPVVGEVLRTPTIQSWSSTAGAGAGVGGVAVIGRETDFAIFESNLQSFRYDQGAEAPSGIRIGVWAYLVVGTRRGSRKATGA